MENKIISLLKTRGLINLNDIAKNINTSPIDNDFLTSIEHLKEEGLINETKSNVYIITSIGKRFESFEKLEEEKSLQTRLAISNIEANELNKDIAEQNKKERKFNKTLLIVNSVFMAGNILTAILHWLKPVE